MLKDTLAPGKPSDDFSLETRALANGNPAQAGSSPFLDKNSSACAVTKQRGEWHLADLLGFTHHNAYLD